MLEHGQGRFGTGILAVEDYTMHNVMLRVYLLGWGIGGRSIAVTRLSPSIIHAVTLMLTPSHGNAENIVLCMQLSWQTMTRPAQSTAARECLLHANELTGAS